MNELQSIVCMHGADCKHQDRPDDGRAGAINFHARKLSQGEDDVTRNENRIRANGDELRHHGPLEASRTS
ncbi:MAG: hypothetical protein DMG54_23140 [Acidobacteria bacterium]|nr:MAG: hypothetical protein DMG54_23140 [Acidobacteriota bacterium]PYU41854.1 MAG: hypothetical protein DMG53_20780 [Acidobacteriota bacterium]PYU70761.1 MAG: hypothetical protein DMG52_24430 [Acidobacteriota bacterium]